MDKQQRQMMLTTTSNGVIHTNITGVCLPEKYAHEVNTLANWSQVFIFVGGACAFVNFTISFMAIVFFAFNRKSRNSPICIYSVCLAVDNLIKLSSSYLLPVLVKLSLAPIGIYVCQLTHFFINFSNQIGICLVIMLQMQRYVAIKANTWLQLLICNYALTYFICFALPFFFFTLDSFYLYKHYFKAIIMCPLTSVFVCLINENFEFLQQPSSRFRNEYYYVMHWIFYMVVPLVCITSINVYILCTLLLKRCLPLILRNVQRTNDLRLMQRSSKDNSRQQRSGHFQVKQTRQPTFIPHSEIFVELSDVSYSDVVVAFVQVLTIMPGIVVNYFESLTMESLGKRLDYILSEVEGDQPQVINEEQMSLDDLRTRARFAMYLMSGATIELLNFSYFLLYQVFSCKSLKNECYKFFVENIHDKIAHYRRRRNTRLA